MGKVSYTSLKLKPIEGVKTFTVGEKEVEVKQYLPSEDKNSLLELTMQTVDTDTIINTFALDIVFHVYLVIEYTNLSFTDTQKADLFKLYDVLETNGIIDKVVENIPESEYKTLRDSLTEMVELYISYRDSARALLKSITSFAPLQAENLAKAADGLDEEKIRNLLEIVREANGPGQI